MKIISFIIHEISLILSYLQCKKNARKIIDTKATQWNYEPLNNKQNMVPILNPVCQNVKHFI